MIRLVGARNEHLAEDELHKLSVEPADAQTVCTKVGQSENELHYAVLDFEFESEAVPLPAKITIKAFPWYRQLIVDRRSFV